MRSWDEVIGDSDKAGNNQSFLARMGTFGQQYTDPLYWIFGRKYTDRLEGWADKGNAFLSKIAKQDPVVQFDRRNNPLQDTKEGKHAGDWAENKPVDSIAAVLGAMYGGGALMGGGSAGGAAGGAAGGGSTAGLGGTAGGGGAGLGSGAAGMEGVTVTAPAWSSGLTGAEMASIAPAAIAASEISQGGGQQQSSNQWKDWLKKNMSAPQQQQQPIQQPQATGARPTLMERFKAGLGKIGDNMLQIDSEAAKSMSPEQVNALKRNALLNMGLGMMAASNQGAGFGEAASFGLGKAQQNLTGALQRGYENARQSREEQRQAQRDQAADERFNKQYERQVAREDRLDERDQRNFDHQMKQEELSQQRFETQQKVQADQFERRMRLAEAKANGVKMPEAPSGYKWNADGTQSFVPGGPADPKNKTGNYQEAERTAAFLGTRLANAMETLKTIPAEDQKPGVMESAAKGLGSEMGANFLRSENRQKANAAQRDALDAALTLATGAAYTKEQIDALRVSYFPQIGDTPSVQDQKKQNFEMLLNAARVKAGRAAGSIDSAVNHGATGSWSVEEVP